MCCSRLSLLLLALLFGSCRYLQPAVEPGAHRSVSFEPGVPNFVLDAVSYVDGTESGVDAALNAPISTFVFARRDTGYVAPIEVIARVLDRRARNVLMEESWSDTLVAATFEETQRFDHWAFSRRIPFRPGNFVIEVRVTSVESGGSSDRRQRVTVVDPHETDPELFGIRMLVHRDTAFVPFAGMHLAADYDSLRAAVDLIRPPHGTEIELQLLRHPSDTTAAVPPYLFAPTGWRLERIGIDYTRPDVIQRTARRLVNPVEQLSLLFSLPPLETGAYEVVIEMRAPGMDPTRLRREFVVMPPEFPRIATLDQMIDALAYITRRNEINYIRQAEDLSERRARFDAFWGGLIPNRRQATEVMQSYYSRVEEANVLFSTYKEGWKTDRGMVYVIMGPPVYVQVEPRVEIWRYSYGNTMLPDYAFTRDISTPINPAYDIYHLNRGPDMERLWDRAVDRWRDGRTV